MKLYLVLRKDDGFFGYLINVVVAADSIQEAEGQATLMDESGEWETTVIAEEAHSDVKRGIVISDYMLGE